MNSLRRAITAERKRLLTLSPISLLQQQHASSSTTTSKLRTLRTSITESPEVKSQPTPEAPTTSSSSNGVGRKESATWPKPSEIPWQAKVVNSVNLIGQVKIPVQFEASSDGKSWAGTIISQDDGCDSLTSPTSFWIPVIFEGDLAHVAKCHLREKDYVHVAGHLSVDVPPIKLREGQANVQVMAHSINFVQGSPQSKKKIAPFKLDERTADSSVNLKNNISVQQSLKELDTMSNQLSRLPKKTSMDVAFEQENGQLPSVGESSPDHYLKEVERLYSDHKVDKKNMDASWRDLLTNPKQWHDNRENKRKGLKKANYPDFKHKYTGVGLWLDRAPTVVLQGLGLLDFNVPLTNGEKLPPSKGEKDGDSWKHLVENPNKWWDNRTDKKNPRAPDFKHKDSGKGLWLGNAPAWALSSLPPVKAKRSM